MIEFFGNLGATAAIQMFIMLILAPGRHMCVWMWVIPAIFGCDNVIGLT